METVGCGLDVVAAESVGKSLEPCGRLYGVRGASQVLGGGSHIGGSKEARERLDWWFGCDFGQDDPERWEHGTG